MTVDKEKAKKIAQIRAAQAVPASSLVITHYAPGLRHEGEWVALNFVTKADSENFYRTGIEPPLSPHHMLSPESIAYSEKTGLLVPLRLRPFVAAFPPRYLPFEQGKWVYDRQKHTLHHAPGRLFYQEGKLLWLAPDRRIWWANEDDPIKDPQKTCLCYDEKKPRRLIPLNPLHWQQLLSLRTRQIGAG